MGKKRIVKKTGQGVNSGMKARSLSRAPRKQVAMGILQIHSTFNNTQITLTDTSGGVLCWSSSGSLGFNGARKGTPFAAAKVGEIIGDKAGLMNMKEVDVIVKGVGAGRESAIRGFISRGIVIRSIRDATPVPHNGPQPPKPRRV